MNEPTTEPIGVLVDEDGNIIQTIHRRTVTVRTGTNAGASDDDDVLMPDPTLADLHRIYKGE